MIIFPARYRTSKEVRTWSSCGTGVAESTSLTRHEPRQFAGKTVTIQGCEYRIGALFRDSSQGYSHALVNLRSGMCLHAMQVRREYRTRPIEALDASRTKQTVTTQLRDSLLAENNPVAVSPVTAIKLHGGSFELHEVQWGMFSDDAPADAATEIARAIRASEGGAVDAALDIMTQVTSKYLTHAAALYTLGGMLADSGRVGETLPWLERTLEVEPNYSTYHGALIKVTAKVARRHALARFDAFASRFAHVHDFDALGAELCMLAGDLVRAETLARSAPLPAAKRDVLIAEVASAPDARQRFART